MYFAVGPLNETPDRSPYNEQTEEMKLQMGKCIVMTPTQSPSECFPVPMRSVNYDLQNHRRMLCTFASCSSSTHGIVAVSSNSRYRMSGKKNENRCSGMTSILNWRQLSCKTDDVVKYTIRMFHRFISTAYDASVLFLHLSI